MVVTLEPAFLLHSRPYSETSALMDLFVQERGIVSGIARGARRRTSSVRAELFAPLLVSYRAKRSDLVTIQQIEISNTAPALGRNKPLLTGFYLNELLMRLLPKADPHPQLFHLYQQTLDDLQQTVVIEPLLRRFEKRLLQELGYGLNFEKEALNSENLIADNDYFFSADQGFTLAKGLIQSAQAPCLFKGSSLLAFRAEDWRDPATLRDAKRLMRLAFAPLLGDKPLKSRSLFIDPGVPAA